VEAEILKILSRIESPEFLAILALLVVIFLLFRHISALVANGQLLVANLSLNNANMEKLTALVNLLCQARMRGREGD
jgi:hypothetical protein